MFFSIELVISALMFIFLISVVLFTKRKYNTIGNYIYRKTLIINIVLLFSEILCVFLIKGLDFPIYINEIFVRIYLLFVTISLSMIAIYIGIKIFDNHLVKDDFFKANKIIIVLFFNVIIFFVSCMFKMNYAISANGYFSINGDGLNIIYIYYSIVYIVFLFFIVINKNNLSSYKRFPIFSFIILYFIAMFINICFNVNILSFIFSLSMISIYYILEDQDIKLVEESIELKEKALQANKAKSIFLSKMSHEIRTPMNTIMGFSESILNNNDNNKIKEDVSNIYNAGLSLLDIINNILDVSSIESGKEKLENSKYNFSDVVYELHSSINSKIDIEKVKFVVDINEEMPCIFIGDKFKIYKVLYNIINNSIKYTSIGEIRLSIKYKIVNSMIELNFEINDTGIGIKQEDYKRIFEKYYEIDIDFDKVQGTGLGLVVVKNLVDMLGGTINFESKYGVGTTFFVNITQEIANDKKIGKILELNEYKNINKNIDYSNNRLLLVDDNEMNLKLEKKLFEKYKFEIDSVNGGIECIEKVKQENVYNFIFLDHMMPNMNGIDALKLLKKLDKCKETKIICMTANAITGVKDNYLNVGFDDYISKPINVRELDKLLKKYRR